MMATDSFGGGIGTDVLPDLLPAGGVAGDRALALRIVNNSQISSNTAARGGGGVYVASEATVTVEIADSIFDANTAAGGSPLDPEIEELVGGAGLWIHGFAVPALPAPVAVFLAVSDSQFTNNIASGDDAFGGAIGIVAESVDMVISNSDIQGNQLTGTATDNFESGGGIAVFGALTVNSAMLVRLEEESEISANTSAGRGGGMFLGGGDPSAAMGVVSIDIKKTSILSNVADEGGGAWLQLVDSTVTSSLDIEDVTVADNSASGDGGGLILGGEASFASVSVNRMTVSGNDTTIDGDGAGMFLDGTNSKGTVTITNSTFFNNNGAGEGGGLNITRYSDAELTNCTIAGNSAVEGGGLWVRDTDVVLTSTILANNTATTDGDDCFVSIFFNGSVSSGGFNIFTPDSIDVNCIGLDGTLVLDPTDQETDPLLAAFDDSDPSPGRQTLPLLASSPAIDAADSAGCEATTELNQDQVLADRVDISGVGDDGDNFQCDVGAQEFVPTCGNGVVEDGEGCDDGNIVSGDGCNENCQVEGRFDSECGDGIVDLARGELCDGNEIDGIRSKYIKSTRRY